MRKRRKIVVIGFSLVGKTAICMRFCNGNFQDSYVPTYENSYRKSIDHDSDLVEVVLLDTQGQDDQAVFRPEYCVGAHGYVLVYSVTSQRSLDACVVLNDKLLNLMGTNKVPRILVGNKIDLEDDRTVSYQKGLATANRIGCKFMECSAKQNRNIDRVFRVLLREIDEYTFERYDDQDSCMSCCRCSGSSCCMQENQSKLLCSSTVLVLATFLLGLAGVLLGLIIGIRPVVTEEEDLIAYVLFGFGMFTGLISILGLIGVVRKNKEYLRVYSWTLGVIAVIEAAVSILIMRSVSLCESYPTESVAVVVIPVVFQVLGVTFSCCLQTVLEDEQEIEYEPLTSPSMGIV